MRQEQKLKLARYKRQRSEARDKEQQQILVKASQSFSMGLADLSDAIKQLVDKPTPEAPRIDLTPIADRISDSIDKLNLNPIIKVESPTIRVEPVINIAPSDDIYARYKRANSITDAQGTYHGFVDSDSNWFIQLESISVDNMSRSRYAVGKGSFAQNWQKRRSLNYKPFDQVSIA